MKRASFLEGVAVALVAALLGSIAATLLPSLLGLATAVRVIVTALSLGYVLYLLRRSPERTGQVVTLSVWVLAAIGSWWFIVDALSLIAVHVGMAWGVRALYHQPGPLAGLLDLGLHVLAMAAGGWAYLHADSVFLGIWTFFLVQALFVAVPAANRRAAQHAAAPDPAADRFQIAYRSAETALRKLSTPQ